uniref:Predicted protein n=1 Tax=Glyptapanteles indiensis TaxID=92994 RepID=A0JCZ0_GLYIN|nr:predicted protein [Glyptapanteles indiensis]
MKSKATGTILTSIKTCTREDNKYKRVGNEEGAEGSVTCQHPLSTSERQMDSAVSTCVAMVSLMIQAISVTIRIRTSTLFFTKGPFGYSSLIIRIRIVSLGICYKTDLFIYSSLIQRICRYTHLLQYGPV